MIRGVVPDDDRVPPPVLVLRVQHLHQLHQEDLHNLAVRVGLQEAEEDAAEVVDAGDERDPGVDADLLFSWTSSSWLPTASLIPDRIQPALVDVDEAALGLEQLEE